MARRGDQISQAQKDGNAAKNAIKESQSRGRQPNNPDLEKRGEAATRAADLKEAAKQAGEPGYR